MSYPIASQNPSQHRQSGYEVDFPLIPHGVSVAVTAPAVFKFTAAADPERHLAAAACFGVDVSQVKRESAGAVLSDAIADFLHVKLGNQPRGLRDLGFEEAHIEGLVDGTIPQARVLGLAPELEADDLEVQREQLGQLFRDAMVH